MFHSSNFLHQITKRVFYCYYGKVDGRHESLSKKYTWAKMSASTSHEWGPPQYKFGSVKDNDPAQLGQLLQ